MTKGKTMTIEEQITDLEFKEQMAHAEFLPAQALADEAHRKYIELSTVANLHRAAWYSSVNEMLAAKGKACGMTIEFQYEDISRNFPMQRFPSIEEEAESERWKRGTPDYAVQQAVKPHEVCESCKQRIPILEAEVTDELGILCKQCEK